MNDLLVALNKIKIMFSGAKLACFCSWSTKQASAIQLLHSVYKLKQTHPKSKLRKFVIDLNGNCPFCNKAVEDIDHVSKNYILVKTLWDSGNILSPSPGNSDCSFVEWIITLGVIKYGITTVYKPLENSSLLLALFGIKGIK